MHASRVLHRTLKSICPSMHANRRGALDAVVYAAMTGGTLSVTGLGRSIESQAKEKHCIKRADRLLSNRYFQTECSTLYAGMALGIIGSSQRPVILVDWSDLDGAKRHFLLRASTPVGGRSLTVYEEVHRLDSKEKPKTHRRFLQRLKAMLATGCCPILVTDAGFQTPWFRLVEQMGWNWVGRVRNRTYVQQSKEVGWLPCKSLYIRARRHAKNLGTVSLTRSNPIDCQLVLYKARPKGRMRVTQFGERARCKHSQVHSAREREPWLLATSLPSILKLAKRVVTLYATRMQIEEAFRDIKSSQYGLGFELSRSYTTERIAALLLIGHLALFIIWLLGKATELTGQARQYQANTVRKRRVLSTIFIGLKVINDSRVVLSKEELLWAAKTLREIVGNEGVEC